MLNGILNKISALCYGEATNDALSFLKNPDGSFMSPHEIEERRHKDALRREEQRIHHEAEMETMRKRVQTEIAARNNSGPLQSVS